MATVERPTATIAVTPDYTALVDLDDVELVTGPRWYALHGHNGKVYAVASPPKGVRQPLYMHRLIAETPEGYETDHVNGNGLDNRRANLRPATASQNRANMWKPRRPGGHSSQFKGVCWDKTRGKWCAKIRSGGRTRNLGRYHSEEDAARAYDAVALAQWGEFARLNFPGEAAA